MAYSTATKALMASALKELVSKEGFEKVSVGEIAELCQMNRKSFYYHFHDKYELVIWIFENEFLQQAKNEDEDLWCSVSALCEYFYKNRAFYKNIITVEGQNSFAEYFRDLCTRTLVNKLKDELEDITITDNNVNMYAGFFVYNIYLWLTGSDKRCAKEFVKDLRNSVIFGAELAKIFQKQ